MSKTVAVGPLEDWVGFYTPNYTPVPDEFFDRLLGILSDVEVRVLLYIIRRTLGFKKGADTISLSQITDGIVKADGTRLDGGAGVSKSGACVAVERLVARGIIDATHQHAADGGYAPTLYQLRMVNTSLSTERTRVVQNMDKGRPRRGQGAVQNVDIQETGIQETAIQERNDSNRPALQKKERETTMTIRRQMNTVGEGTPPPAPRPRPALAPYIAGVIEDISRDLGDLDHSNSNITQALRLWQEADLEEIAFVALLREVKGTVRHYQAGGIGNKMAYFFQTLRDRLSKQDRRA